MDASGIPDPAASNRIPSDGNTQVPVYVFREELLDIEKRRRRAVGNTFTPEFTAAVAAAADIERIRNDIAATESADSLLGQFLKDTRRVLTRPRELLLELARRRQERLELRKTLDGQLKAAEAKCEREARPRARLGLVGLALSGGGIRSATFNFGLLQALAARGMLMHVDYLSTVSGGGYIGGCLSSVLTDTRFTLAPDGFPFRQESGQADSPMVRRIRDSGRYLAPGGLIDRARIPSLVLIGIIVNLLIIAPYLMILACLTEWTYGGWMRAYRAPGATLPNLLVGQDLIDLVRGAWDPGLLVLHWTSKVWGWLINAIAGDLYWPPANDVPLFAPTLTLAAVLLIGIAVFPIIRLVTRSSWNRRNATERAFTLGLILLGVTLTLNSLPLAVAVYDRGVRWPSSTQALVTVLTALAPFVFAARKASGVSNIREKLSIYALGLFAPALLVWIYVQLSYWLVSHAWNFGMFAVAIALIVITWQHFDVNLTSLHGFYRDRLSRAFLFRLDSGETIANDDQLLIEANEMPSHAPYHLINATLNLQGSEGFRPRRDADFFLFSKRFSGSDRTGYCRTSDLQQRDPGLNLGTAIAISGAALAPNMGSSTVRPLVSAMALLNVRTGYWIPNPRFIESARVARRSWLGGTGLGPIVFAQEWLAGRVRWTGVGPLYFLYEMLGRLDERRHYVNVSDGGHVENLGLYELLRRRCQFVVVCDAEEDVQMTFNGLARVVRYARIDCGVTIDINVEDLRRNSAGLSSGHFAVGTINYGEGAPGQLLYVKASLTGDESEDIKEYHARQSRFPNESTGQQFFNEGQFEAYRALGQHIGENLFESVLPIGNGQTVLTRWFDELVRRSQQRYPRGVDVPALQRELSRIEESFQDTALAEYTYEIYPELGPQSTTASTIDAAERSRRIFHLCHRQLQFMENVFVSLSLHERRNHQALINLGYLSLFNRWARTPLFRRAIAVSLGVCSPAFREFCAETLDLRPALWRRGSREDVSAEQWAMALSTATRIPSIGQLEGDTQPFDEVWICERPSSRPSPRRVGIAVIRISAGVRGEVGTMIFCRIDEADGRSVIGEIMPRLREALFAGNPGLTAVQYMPIALVPAPFSAVTHATIPALTLDGWQVGS